MEVFMDHLQSCKREMATLIHDGGLVYKLPGEAEFPAEVLCGCEEAVRQRLGETVVKLQIKPMEESLFIPADENADSRSTVTGTELRGPLSVRSGTNTASGSAVEAEYQEVKQRFENESGFAICRIITTKRFRLEWIEGKKPIMYATESELHTLFRGWKLPSGGSFIARWVADLTVPQYLEEDFCPPPNHCAPLTLNVWRPFRLQTLLDEETRHGPSEGEEEKAPENQTPTLVLGSCLEVEDEQEPHGWIVRSGDPDPERQVQERLERILWHILEIVCGGDATVGLYFLKYLAHMLQLPGEKPGVAVLMQGRMGVGKDCLIAWFREKIVGTHLSLPVAQLSDILGKFANQRASKILVHLEEGCGDSFRAIDNMVKAYITQSTICVERKGMESYTIQDLSRFFVSTNEESGAVHPREGDRRWLCLSVSDVKKGDHEYFEKLFEAFADDSVALRFGKLLLGMDIRGFHPRKHLPTTDLKVQMMQSTATPLMRFLAFIVRPYVTEGADGSLVPREAVDQEDSPPLIPRKKQLTRELC
jgi:hypothetical protein